MMADNVGYRLQCGLVVLSYFVNFRFVDSVVDDANLGALFGE